MGTVRNDGLRDTIRATLVQRAGDSPDASAIAKATVSTWQQMAVRLAPVIGWRGVDVLFSRALYLTGSRYPWLAVAAEDGNGVAQAASFRTRLETQKADVAAAASCALLVTFTELLATLIGDALTERLLRPVWAPPPSASEEETAP